MADFARWVSAAEPGLGWPEGAFMSAYQTNRDNEALEAIESEPVAFQIVKHIQSSWEGTAAELNAFLLRNLRPEQRKCWPKDAARFGQVLRRVSPMLRRVGYQVTQTRGRARLIRIEVPK